MILKLKGGKFLEVINEIPEYQEQVEYRLMSFKKINSAGSREGNLLHITPRYTKIRMQNKEYILNKKLLQTDLYTIINAMITLIISDEKNAFMHSSVVSKNNEGILLLGIFGQGKTTLALELEKRGFEINSSDYTHLQIKGNKLFMKLGSKYLKYTGGVRFLEEDKINSIIEIKEVVLLAGICDEGEYKKVKIEDNNHKIKKLFPFLNWWINSPLITDPKIILENLTKKKSPHFNVGLS